MKLHLWLPAFLLFLFFSNHVYNTRVLIHLNTDKHSKIDTVHKSHWSYAGETGPEHWAEIEKNSVCDGLYQSPINLLTRSAKTESSASYMINIDYAAKTLIHDVVNNGHSIQFDFEEGDRAFFNDNEYHLKQIHFHEEAEHTIDGIRYPIEIHLVHYSEQANDYLVLGILGKAGVDSAPIAMLESYLPLAVGSTKIIDTPFDLTTLLPEQANSYFHYKGSLTTPPCSEKVNWIVFNNAIELSMQQVDVLKGLMPIHNYRNIQPLNGRSIFQVQLTKPITSLN